MTNKQFVEFCKKAKDKLTMYMWGDYGRPITEATIAAKAKQYPVNYSAAYQTELRAKVGSGIGCDCTGLIKWFLWTGGDIEVIPKYNAPTDNSASGWYRVAKVRGAIDGIPETPGLIVSMSGHCGVYIGGGKVIECTKGAFGNGVVQTKLTDRKWKKWCECAYIEYDKADSAETSEIVLIPARVIKDCFSYSTLNQKQRIGEIYAGEAIRYIGAYGSVAAVIYSTAATQKIAFIDKSNIAF